MNRVAMSGFALGAAGLIALRLFFAGNTKTARRGETPAHEHRPRRVATAPAKKAFPLALAPEWGQGPGFLKARPRANRASNAGRALKAPIAERQSSRGFCGAHLLHKTSAKNDSHFCRVSWTEFSSHYWGTSPQTPLIIDGANTTGFIQVFCRQ